MRVSIDDVPTFLEHEEYRPLLLLLALVTTSHGLSLAVAGSLLDHANLTLGAYLEQVGVEDETGFTGRRPLAEKLRRIDFGEVLVSDVTRWLPVVGRFSFSPGLAEATPQRQLPGTLRTRLSAPRREPI